MAESLHQGLEGKISHDIVDVTVEGEMPINSQRPLLYRGCSNNHHKNSCIAEQGQLNHAILANVKRHNLPMAL